jgi:uncharacterized membrane protein
MPPVVGFIGKLHFLVLHFPIAVLFGVVLIEILLRKRVAEEKRRDVVSLLLLLAASAAVISAATGLANAAEEDFHGYALTLLTRHRGGGIAVAVLSILCFAAHRMEKARTAYLPLLGLATLAVTATGHIGGQLVHGENYLLSSFSKDKKGDDDDSPRAVSDGDEGGDEERQRHPEGKVPDKPTYAKDIKPLIDRSCVKCHGPEKRKSGLRLDKKRFAMKGGETGLAIVPGDPEKSLFYKYISAPPDDDDVMPSKGKLLALSEIETVKRWIEQGAEWPDDP